jgi:CBS-domain-containing membrane protein
MRVIVVGRSPEKMDAAIAVLESHGFAATGVFSEQEAARAIAEQDELFAVVAGGSIDQPAQERLRAAAGPKGAVLITAYIGHDDPKVHFENHVIPKLADARDRAH